ncbi:glycoside hydrolase family 88 protein [Tetragenococcus halophilus]|uniref:glycoside hydrolase family 88 protein n=1 Tax=Tetragenococcus halophilus TaxID=51669 RepID=UPI0015C1B7C6|nr:glucuronyl hydrolase [Tetragenococcus halophilus]
MSIKQKRLIDLGKNITDEWLNKQILICIHKIKKNQQRFGNKFPSACATNGKYRIKENDDWTNGFWTGMLWLSYEITKDNLFIDVAMENIVSFKERLDKHYVLDHHDIGFLYSLSAVAGYQITGNEVCKNEILESANLLLNRYHEKGEFIQAWGKFGDPKEYRLIIDSLMNLPLLFRASEISRDAKYRQVAIKHYNTLLKNIVREDGTTFHTYYFDPQTGQPMYGATYQGNSDHSIWARGQSWANLGIPIVQGYLTNTTYPVIYPKILDAFINRLPSDLVPYWDFDFDDQNPSDKDSSSLAVTACGLLEAEKSHAYPEAKAIAKGMIYQLGEHYLANKNSENEGLLLHGVYAHKEGKGVDEPNLWGDYFYLEALVRLAKPAWEKYW